MSDGIYFQPWLSKSDHAALKRIWEPSDRYLTNSYDEWLQFALKEGKEDIGISLVIRRVEINADEFARYCDRTGSPRNARSLRSFAEERGKAYGNR